MRKIPALSLALLLMGGLAPSAARAYTTDLTRPILFVHGFDPAGWPCPGYDLTAYWGTTISFLQSRGWSGPMVKVGYYACDYNTTDSLDYYGSHSAYHGSTGHVTAPDTHLSHDQDGDIMHLAYHLAWMIYTKYSSHGVTVQLVTHSMGGDIGRWMLYRIANHDPAFPPYLYIQDAMAIAPPNNGASSAFACGYVECNEMRPNSSFMNELNGTDTGLNPRATNGTDYSVMTSSCDTVVAASSALSIGSAVHKVQYTSPCYGHSDFLGDILTSQDAVVNYANPPATTLQSWSTAPHALLWLDNALRSSTW